MGKAQPWAERWEKGEQIGAGGQGTAFRARSRDGTLVNGVLKLLKRQDDERARGRMRREVVALGSLSAEGLKVPRVIEDNTDHYQDPSVPLYFVMEEIAGRTLEKEITARGRVDLDKALALVTDLAATVQAAHAEDVLHRDLKPNNIMVRDFDKNDLVILDYGLSFNQVEAGGDLTALDEQFKSKFLTLPETNALVGNRRDPRSDITSICAILYYCLTGHAPRHLRDAAGRPPHRSGQYSVRAAHPAEPRLAAVEAFLDRGLGHDLEYRFQTWDEFNRRLAAIRDSGGRVAEDPVAVAREASAWLRQSDKLALAEEQKQHLPTLFQAIQARANAIGGQLGPHFRVSLATQGIDGTMPNGMHAVGTQGVIVAVTLMPDRFHQFTLFAVGLLGGQCALVRHTQVVRGTAGPNWKTLDWQEVFWFQPDRWPTAEALAEVVDGDISAGIRGLMKEVESTLS